MWAWAKYRHCLAAFDTCEGKKLTGVMNPNPLVLFTGAFLPQTSSTTCMVVEEGSPQDSLLSLALRREEVDWVIPDAGDGASGGKARKKFPPAFFSDSPSRMDFVVGLYVAWNAASWQSRSTTTGQDATCSKGRGGTGIQLPLLLRNKWYPVRQFGGMLLALDMTHAKMPFVK